MWDQVEKCLEIVVTGVFSHVINYNRENNLEEIRRAGDKAEERMILWKAVSVKAQILVC